MTTENNCSVLFCIRTTDAMTVSSKKTVTTSPSKAEGFKDQCERAVVDAPVGSYMYLSLSRGGTSTMIMHPVDKSPPPSPNLRAPASPVLTPDELRKDRKRSLDDAWKMMSDGFHRMAKSPRTGEPPTSFETK